VLSRLQPDGTTVTGVFVAEKDVARWVPVTLAAREDDRVAVEPIEGGALSAGAQVLTAGHIDLADGSAIAVTAEPAP
jgi:hypothetical protein